MSWTILLVLTSCYSLLGEGASWSWNDFWLNVGKTGQEKGGDDYVDWLGDSFTSSFSSSSNSWYWSTTPTEYHTCPPDYPWVFYSGRYCCKHIYEKFESLFDRSCDGGPLTISSKCCQDDDYVVCDTRPCTDYSAETTEPAGTSTSYKDPSSSPPTSPTISTITSRSPTASSPSTDWDTPPIDDTKTYKMEEDEDSEDIEKAVTAYYSDYSGWWDWDDYLVTRPPPHPPLPPHPPIPPPTDVEIYEQELVDIVCMFLSTFGDICDPQSQQNPKPLTELSDPYYDPFYDSYYDPWLYDPYYSYDPYYYPHTDSMDDTGMYINAIMG
ncbi:proteoglycan 4-like [Bolinopsis microptera]|uniref:proteoglycan 4-like n=1 Tax=Bolinopsis microptera TaxID=2820187 RepID=UPI003079E8CF